jgi:hypothetical protein
MLSRSWELCNTGRSPPIQDRSVMLASARKEASLHHWTQILPKCSPLSRYANDSGNSPKAKVRSMTGRTPVASSAAI